MQFLSMFLRVETEITLSPGNRVILSYSAVSRPLRKQAPNPLFRSWWMVRTTGHCALISSMSAAVPSVLPSLTMMISIVTFPAALAASITLQTAARRFFSSLSAGTTTETRGTSGSGISTLLGSEHMFCRTGPSPIAPSDDPFERPSLQHRGPLWQGFSLAADVGEQRGDLFSVRKNSPVLRSEERRVGKEC